MYDGHRVRLEEEPGQSSSGFMSPIALVRHITKSVQSRKSAKTLHIVVHNGVSIEIDKMFADDCIEDGSMELVRWFREGSVLVMIYHWTN